MRQYNHKKIEKKWQTIWEKEGIFRAQNKSKKPKYYSLIEFPYPSGAGMHVGHIRSNTAMDIISRKRRMEGFNVLYPIGWDAFGLPTENYAIKTGIHPIKVTKDNTDTFRKQLKSLGFSFDWSREINTTDTKYYKWTQWIFLQLFKKGLAYKAKMFINWCPSCKIGLANEEVVDGACERCGTTVEKKEKEQWMLAITKYADRLYKDLDDVDYLEKIKIQQRNWIGRSEGVEIEFKIINPSLALPEGEGKIPGYYTTDAKLWRVLQDKALEMRKNPTDGEKIIWEILRRDATEYHFRRQHIIGRFIVDFVCLEKGLVVEIDGDIHDHRKEEDKERTKMLEQMGFEVVRFTNDEVIKKPENVFKKIIEKINLASKRTLPFGEGQGGVELGNVKIFSTRADTLFGATFIAVAPELAKKITGKDFGIKVDTDRDNKEKIGVNTGLRAKNPANGEMIPVFAVNYVSADYGTGAIMGVPAHDERDFEFAKKYNLPIIPVIFPNKAVGEEAISLTLQMERDLSLYKKYIEDHGAFIGNGYLINSSQFNGNKIIEAKRKITEFVNGKEKTTYKLRDWVFSRQRYWGEPIPVVNCEKCGLVPIPEKDLPVELPKVKNYQPTDSGESPLANMAKWVNTKCPKCKGPAKRETDTMPNWAGSSWYFLRYTDSKNNKEFASKKNLDYWLTPSLPPPKGEALDSFSLPFGEGQGGVDWYNGGMEHTTLHLLYSRFWHKFLYDLKLVPTSEPYAKRTSHGMILAEGGDKMSKSKGNVVNPDDLIKTYGADTLRMYEMFMGPFDQAVSWSTDSMIGPRRFLERVWKMSYKVIKLKVIKENKELERLLHQTVKKVAEDIENMRFNTAISAMMIFVNEVEKNNFQLSTFNFKTFLQLLSPFAPHIAEELWSMLGEKKSINNSLWPKWDANFIKDNEIKIVIQINGKLRAEIVIQAEEKEEDVKHRVFNNETVLKHTAGKDIKKVIYVKNRLINIVI
ncbi:hypothetical protein A3H53_01485 [Candidatus Nomurabacteria bacterium RIFCSPLOWO2_02_FULL_40_10]|uniref:Leucine--tRNA ligase n=2 Tax=Candidatus Nomuraibacteriota TaxID=1752729 RepID=A0A1F6XZ39_9BACT|nr:MAG: hypothetical protein A2642_01510 [Candidatus Nomurabacteria bacterium RIFCSPHIGHO2_01_FULL_39_10]OGI99392.1 MAG: hypothetical protein A3H53_01485 [Candidatus Nomurabacteria bacterium RIFCSPLOWO2_02_FULL_40_10]